MLPNTINVFERIKKEMGRLIRRNLIFKVSTPGLLKTIIGLNCSSIIIRFNWCVLCEDSSSIVHFFKRNFQFWKVQLLFSLFSLPTKSSLHIISYQHSAIDNSVYGCLALRPWLVVHTLCAKKIILVNLHYILYLCLI